MYPEEFVQPMRHELTSIGFRELRTPAEVDALLTKPIDFVLLRHEIDGRLAKAA